MPLRGFRPLAAVVLAGLAVAGCTERATVEPPSPGGDRAGASAESAGFATFPDLPMPTRAEMAMDQTLVFGAEDSWIGRLVLTTPYDVENMFSFYQREMPRFGWQEITSVRAETSVLAYSRGERVATIQIRRQTLRRSEAAVTVSPRGRNPEGGGPVATPVAPLPPAR